MTKLKLQRYWWRFHFRTCPCKNRTIEFILHVAIPRGAKPFISLLDKLNFDPLVIDIKITRDCFSSNCQDIKQSWLLSGLFLYLSESSDEFCSGLRWKKQKQESGNDSKELEDESVAVIDKFSEFKWVLPHQLKVFSINFKLIEVLFNLCENYEVQNHPRKHWHSFFLASLNNINTLESHFLLDAGDSAIFSAKPIQR